MADCWSECCESEVGHGVSLSLRVKGDLCLIYSLVFVSSTTEVHSCAANAGQSIKEIVSVVPWIDRRVIPAA